MDATHEALRLVVDALANIVDDIDPDRIMYCPELAAIRDVPSRIS